MTLSIRKLRISDAKRVYELFADDDILRYLSFQKKANSVRLDDELKYVKDAIKNYGLSKPKNLSMAIVLNGALIGVMGLHKIDYAHEKAEIGYWIGKPYWGKGYASAALKLFLTFVYKRFRLNRLEAGVFLKNPASARVLEKNGFRYEGIRRQSLKKGNKYVVQLVFQTQ